MREHGDSSLAAAALSSDASCDGTTVKANHAIIMLYTDGVLHRIPRHRDRQLGAVHPNDGTHYRTGAISADTEIANAVFCDKPRIFRLLAKTATPSLTALWSTARCWC